MCDGMSESKIDKREELKEFLCNFRKDFLKTRLSGDGRKKLHNGRDVLLDSSTEGK